MNKYLIIGSSYKQNSHSIITRDISRANIEITYFPNKEKRIYITSDVAESEVIILQSFINNPDEYIIETMLIADAAIRKGAKKITAVTPWFGYSPQDKVFREGEPISAELVIKILEASGIDEFHIFDIHASHLLSRFSKPVYNHTSLNLIYEYLKNTVASEPDKYVSVAVDKGSTQRASETADLFNIPLVQFDKERDRKTGEVKFIPIAADLRGKKVVVFDDYVNTGSTLIQSAEYAKEIGAEEFIFCVTHILVHSALDKILASPIDKIVTTNSTNLPLQEEEKLTVLNVFDTDILG
jgi:ribose-phosphate pyrophosphokinase